MWDRKSLSLHNDAGNVRHASTDFDELSRIELAEVRPEGSSPKSADLQIMNKWHWRIIPPVLFYLPMQ
jgi:hypothetical protein